MDKEFRIPNTSNSSEDPQNGGIRSSRPQSEERYNTKEEKPYWTQDYSEEDIDKAMHVFGRWLLLRFKEASFIEFVQAVLGVLVLIVGIFAACVYDGQLAEMRNTNQLTAQAIIAAGKANELTKALVVNEDQPYIFIQAEGSCSSKSFRVSFRNTGKIRATGFTGKIRYGTWVPGSKIASETKSIEFGDPNTAIDPQYPLYEWLNFPLPDCVPIPKPILNQDVFYFVDSLISFDNGFGTRLNQEGCVFFWNGNSVDCVSFSPLWKAIQRTRDQKR